MSNSPNSPEEQFALAQEYYEEADVLLMQNKPHLALPILQKAYEIPLTSTKESKMLRATILHCLSHCFMGQNAHEKALSFNQQALDIVQQVMGKEAEETLAIQIFMGRIWSVVGKHHDALEYLHNILAPLEAVAAASLQYAILHMDIGLLHRKVKDYWQAILYFQKSVQLFQAVEEDTVHWEALVYNGIGMSHSAGKNHEQAVYYFQKALDKFSKCEDTNQHHIAGVYSNLGGIHHSLEQYPEAIDRFQKSLNILYSLEGNQTAAIAFIEMGLGRTYLKTSNFSEADHFLKKALESHLQILDKQHPLVARNYYIIAQLYIQQKNHPAAIHACQQGLQVCSGFLASENKYQNPSLEDIHHHACIPLLSSKAEAFRAYYLSSTSNPKDLEAALESATLAVSVMEKIRLGYHSDHSKLSIEHTFSKVYETGLEASYTAWKESKETDAVEKAFFFAEKAKAVLLLSAMQGAIAKVQSPIPPSLLGKEEELKAHLIQLDKAIQTQKTSKNEAATKETHIQNLQIEFLDYHSQYSELMQKLEQAYPDYYQIKYQTQSISIAEIQSLLQAKELLIQYSLYANQLFIFAIDRNTISMEVVKLSEDFLGWITAFQETMFLSDLEEYISTALQLYQVLFQPIENQLKGKEQLLIIPDGALHSLPFDALISPIAISSAIENFSQLPYLLHQFQVQYHYSATLIGQSHFKKQLELRSKIQDGFLGVAPVKFGKRVTDASGYILKSNGNNREIILKSGVDKIEVLVDLAETEVEVKKVYELFEASDKEAIALFYEMASKENLLKYIEDYKHILLSSHGFSDTENAALSGLNLYVEEEGETAGSTNEKGKLYLSEVMNLQLKADLVVLSSCESGVGKLQKGEGMMALHRAFLYAGASNIIYSLFKVPQDSTSELVQTFFGYVLEGDNYSTALRKAKLKLIGDESIEPIDWAGFALIGV